MKKYWMLLTLFCGVTNTYAQTEQEEIKKEDVVVEFSFNPTLSDVFKLKTNPKIKEDFKKSPIVYKIKPKKVESDFNPTIKKATYLKVDETKPKNYYNYIYAAAGLYGNTELLVAIKPKAIKKINYGFNLFNYNKQKGIEDERVDNNHMQTNFNFYIGKKLKQFNWKANVLYDRNAVNWYGLNSVIADPTVYQNQNFNQIYSTIEFNGDIDYNNGSINNLSPSLKFFSDEFGTTETQLKASTTLDKSIFKDYIETKISFEYLNGSFSQNYIDDSNVAYSFINLIVNPTYSYTTDNFKIDANLNLVLNINSEASKTNFFFLPSVIATIPMIKNIMVLKGGIKSSFVQNSYASLVNKNAFVSPTLNIQASNTPVKLFVGLQGELSHTVSYNAEVGYSIENNKLLFVNNPNTGLLANPYQFGNTFSVLYNDVKVFNIKANLRANIIKNLDLGVNTVFNSYQINRALEAWNLPVFNIEAYVNYSVNKWFTQLGLNTVSSRKDFVNNTTIDIDGYVDINIKGGYKINKKLNAHLNIYNLLNNNYETFVNYQVQGFQALAGLSYKF